MGRRLPSEDAIAQYIADMLIIGECSGIRRCGIRRSIYFNMQAIRLLRVSDVTDNKTRIEAERRKM